MAGDLALEGIELGRQLRVVVCHLAQPDEGTDDEHAHLHRAEAVQN